MPNNLLFADMSMFPVIGEEEETRSALKKILNYQFLLTEQLRYTLYNLGEENLNEAEWHSLTEPIYARIQDADGNIAELSLNAKELRAKLSDAEGNIGQLSLTAESLSTQISNAQGDISSLHQTAESLSTQISNAQGDISTLKQTAQSLSTQISNAQGDISSLHQTAESLSSRISNAQGDISTLSQTANSLSSRISNAQGDISTLSQTAQSLSTQISNAQDSVSTLRQDVESITLSVENGDKSSTISLKMDETVISSGRITLAGDVVFVDDLTDGTTEISGDNIQTGMISAEYIKLGGEMTVYKTLGGKTEGGSIGYVEGKTYSETTEGIGLISSNGDGMVFATTGGAKIAYKDDCEISVNSSGVSVCGNLLCAGNVAPVVGHKYTLGYSGYPWAGIYVSTSAMETSDRKEKRDISYCMDEYEALFFLLRPASYRLIGGSSGRRHTGFIAQDIEASLIPAGLSDLDFAAFVKSPRTEEEGIFDYSLRYSEFIALNTYMIQKLYRRVEALESRI